MTDSTDLGCDFTIRAAFAMLRPNTPMESSGKTTFVKKRTGSRIILLCERSQRWINWVLIRIIAKTRNKVGGDCRSLGILKPLSSQSSVPFRLQFSKFSSLKLRRSGNFHLEIELNTPRAPVFVGSKENFHPLIRLDVTETLPIRHRAIYLGPRNGFSRFMRRSICPQRKRP